MENQKINPAEEFNFVPESELPGFEEVVEGENAKDFADRHLTHYGHENSRGDRRAYYPKENSRGWVGANQCDYFVMYSIPEDGGRTAVASIWMEDEHGNKVIQHYDLGKLLTPILQHYTSLNYQPASYGE